MMANQPDSAPELVFEIRHVVGALTSDGFARPQYSSEVAVRSDAALRLMDQIGAENFALLLTLAMKAEVREGTLRVESATEVIQSTLKWSRNKVNQRFRLLSDAGYITRNQQTQTTARGMTFGKSYLVLHADLYTTTHRPSHENEYLLAPRIPADQKLGYGEKPADQKAGYEENPADQKPGYGRESAGQPVAQIPADQEQVYGENPSPADQIPVDQEQGSAEISTKIPAAQKPGSTETVQHHDYEYDYELHRGQTENEKPTPETSDSDTLQRISQTVDRLPNLTPPPPVDLSKITAENAHELTRQQITTILLNWKVFDGASLTASTPLRFLQETVAVVVSRRGNIKNPGAYFRKLLSEAIERNSKPTPAQEPEPTPTPPVFNRETPTGKQSPTSANSVETSDKLSSEDVHALLNQLPEEVRTKLIEETREEVRKEYPSAVGYGHLMDRLIDTHLAEKFQSAGPPSQEGDS